ncbi:glutathione S-transferase [Bordetella genomosp. 7]|uniref:Glutathione S-transferase n=1 Tax=Bordetella genomosp. 7 TaxID=1416805 RepID=A0A261QVW0_9BORD|nr:MULTISPECIES: glutathione S-transferase [Bordetella]OZI16861.1 glutathione S-transferase [Bordetella genomosp. 7]OZI17067.1 glutathione S-transferase [Bordetella genomosp. 7]
MKLFYSPTSPFVRKCMVVAHETGLIERIEPQRCAAHPVNRDQSIVAANPLGQVPTLVTDDGQTLHDSRVICEYLNQLGGGALVPPDGPARWQALTDQSLADGLVTAAIQARYETTVRPESAIWQGWVDAQMSKVADALARFEEQAGSLAGRWDIGTIALACALGYLDFRYASYDWRARHPSLARWHAAVSERPSLIETAPSAP